NAIPVTAIKVGPNFVIDVKNYDRDKYSAVKLGFESKKQQRVNKPQAGIFKKAEVGAFKHVKEIRCDVETLGWNEIGKEIKMTDVFAENDFIDVTGVTIGRGFAGVVKKFRVKGQPSTRGTHENRRHIGSIGMCKTPGRVLKNTKMPGHLGNAKRTVQNLKVVAFNVDENVLFVKGCVPGPKEGLLIVKKAIKKILKKAA
ncbi:UNVERIFIED_CONTAM: hypothetical protein GTU68_051322, partial [Idotea baltica]|nr:hypothetical protein [Idotea baltica]